MIKKILIITIPTIVLGACLYLSISAYIKYSDDYIRTYVASHQLNQRTLIKDVDIEEVLVPKEYLGDDVYINKEDIIGKYVKLSYSLAKGSLLYKGALESDIKDLANTLLLDNQVNYDLFINDVKINTGGLSKSMYVDLYLTINNNDKPISDLFLSNARVTGLYDNNGKQIMDYDSDTRVSIVSLAVDKNDVSYINKALLLGDIKVIVSNNYNPNIVSTLNKNSNIFDYLK